MKNISFVLYLIAFVFCLLLVRLFADAYGVEFGLWLFNPNYLIHWGMWKTGIASERFIVGFLVFMEIAMVYFFGMAVRRFVDFLRLPAPKELHDLTQQSLD